MTPRSALDVLVDLNERVTTGHLAEYQPVPLGFTPLDKTIGTGLRAGELLLIGGAQGTGKTTMALQMARNIASGGQANVLYLCFEHDEPYLLNRLIAMESALAHLPHKTGAIKIQDVRKEIVGSWMAEGAVAPQLTNNPRLRPSLDRIARYGQNLFLLRGSQTTSTIENIRKLVQQHRDLSGDRRLVVFVDYIRGGRHPDPQREVPHRRQGQHRVQPVPGPAIPRLGDRVRREESWRPGQRGPRVREALRVLLLRPERAHGPGELIEERLYND